MGKMKDMLAGIENEDANKWIVVIGISGDREGIQRYAFDPMGKVRARNLVRRLKKVMNTDQNEAVLIESTDNGELIAVRPWNLVLVTCYPVNKGGGNSIRLQDALAQMGFTSPFGPPDEVEAVN